MDSSSTSPITTTLKPMRIMLFVASLLVLAVGIPLYLMPGQTDKYFSWTINPPLTAAFLGGGYWASFLLEILSARERTWARARLAVPAVEAFTALTLIVTLVHRDRFHFDSPEFITVAGTWVWLGVYAVVPIVLGGVLIQQVRAATSDPARVAPLPGAFRTLLGLQGAIMLVIGAIMLVAPDQIISAWPWKLSALTSRAIGAWGVGIGTAAVHAAWENDWWRSSAMMTSYAAYGVLQILNLIRFSDTLDWQEPSAILYTAFIGSILVVGGYGFWQTRRYQGDGE